MDLKPQDLLVLLKVTDPLANSVRATPDVGSRLSLAEAQAHENVLQAEISEKNVLGLMIFPA